MLLEYPLSPTQVANILKVAASNPKPTDKAFILDALVCVLQTHGNERKKLRRLLIEAVCALKGAWH